MKNPFRKADRLSGYMALSSNGAPVAYILREAVEAVTVGPREGKGTMYFLASGQKLVFEELTFSDELLSTNNRGPQA